MALHARRSEPGSLESGHVDARSDASRPAGNKEIQLAILYDAKTNLERYSMWQEYFRKHQPPTLIVWGKNDGIFTVEGARLYTKDLKNAEFHLFDTGHFALEEDLEE